MSLVETGHFRRSLTRWAWLISSAELDRMWSTRGATLELWSLWTTALHISTFPWAEQCWWMWLQTPQTCHNNTRASVSRQGSIVCFIRVIDCSRVNLRVDGMQTSAEWRRTVYCLHSPGLRCSIQAGTSHRSGPDPRMHPTRARP